MFLYTQELAEQLTKAIEALEVKVSKENSFRVVITEEVADRDGETIILAGGDLKNYKKNPVILMDHSYKVEHIIGKTTSLSIIGKQMIAEGVWADTEDAMLAKRLYDGGFLKTSSIGFIPLQRDESDRSIITKWELLEWSFVAVPCNPDALSMDEKMKKTYENWVHEGWVKEGFKSIFDTESIKEDDPITEAPTEPEAPQPTEFEAKILSEMSEIKSMLATLADGKVKRQEVEAEVAKLKEQKEIMQAISRGMSSVLENVKKL